MYLASGSRNTQRGGQATGTGQVVDQGILSSCKASHWSSTGKPIRPGRSVELTPRAARLTPAPHRGYAYVRARRGCEPVACRQARRRSPIRKDREGAATGRWGLCHSVGGHHFSLPGNLVPGPGRMTHGTGSRRGVRDNNRRPLPARRCVCAPSREPTCGGRPCCATSPPSSRSRLRGGRPPHPQTGGTNPSSRICACLRIAYRASYSGGVAINRRNA